MVHNDQVKNLENLITELKKPSSSGKGRDSFQ
jgi:hypothetical protein